MINTIEHTRYFHLILSILIIHLLQFSWRSGRMECTTESVTRLKLCRRMRKFDKDNDMCASLYHSTTIMARRYSVDDDRMYLIRRLITKISNRGQFYLHNDT